MDAFDATQLFQLITRKFVVAHGRSSQGIGAAAEQAARRARGALQVVVVAARAEVPILRDLVRVVLAERPVTGLPWTLGARTVTEI
jgi:hypothetical protein